MRRAAAAAGGESESIDDPRGAGRARRLIYYRIVDAYYTLAFYECASSC